MREAGALAALVVVEVKETARPGPPREAALGGLLGKAKDELRVTLGWVWREG